jgi:hypothetical protein
MYVKNYKGDFQDLGLTMSYSEELFGNNIEVSLIPNGENVPVTEENKFEYIMLVSNYILN